MILTVITTISFIGLLSYYIIFSRIKISSFKTENIYFEKPISVIICAKNELENIKTFFPFWINQNYKNFELIIVNDESDDGSFEYLSELEKSYKNLRVLHINRGNEKDEKLLHLKGKRYALHKGVVISKNEYILLTDADCKPLSTFWIQNMANAFNNKKTEIVLGYSPYYKEKKIVNFLIQLETTLTALHYLGFANIRFPYMGVGRNVAYKKSILTKNVFQKSNKSLSGDDDLIIKQLATKINTEYIISKHSIVESIPAKSINEWINQKKRHLGAGFHYSIKMKALLNIFPILNVLIVISVIVNFSIYNLCVFLLNTLIIFILIKQFNKHTEE